MNRRQRQRKALELLAALALTVWFFIATLGASGVRSATYDEVLHLGAGWIYTTVGDFRLHPTNGNLMQRWLTAPYLFIAPKSPSRDAEDFLAAPKLGEEFGKSFLYRVGNDHEKLLFWGRAPNAVLGALLGAFIYRLGGFFAFAFYVLCPNLLAHSGLATSDVGSAFGFTIVLWTWNRLLNFWTLWRLIAASVATALLFAVKMSAPLAIIMVLLLAGVKWMLGRPWRLKVGRRSFVIRRPDARFALLMASVFVMGLVIWASLWTLYGWRFSAFAPPSSPKDQWTEPWHEVLRPQGRVGELIRACRDYRVLPEAYLFGFAHTLKYAKERATFLNGAYSETGWRIYFPMAFAMKMPIPALLFLLVGFQLGYRRWMLARKTRRLAFIHRSAPWWVLIAVYGAVAVQTNLNIGFRHLLPILPALFVLAGGSVRRSLYARGCISLLLVWSAVEAVRIHPYQLAYFNSLAGGPSMGYRRLVDSNLDWGQDLPGLAQWLKEGPDRGEVYLEYFGTAVPKAYDIDAPPPFEMHVDDRGLKPDVDLGGYYCISATLLIAPSRGPPHWQEYEENLYRQLIQAYSMADATEKAALRENLLIGFSMRLRLGLLERKPIQQIGYSIFIFPLTDAEVREILFGSLRVPKTNN